jgi:hypothetical protein
LKGKIEFISANNMRTIQSLLHSSNRAAGALDYKSPTANVPLLFSVHFYGFRATYSIGTTIANFATGNF